MMGSRSQLYPADRTVALAVAAAVCEPVVQNGIYRPEWLMSEWGAVYWVNIYLGGFAKFSVSVWVWCESMIHCSTSL